MLPGDSDVVHVDDPPGGVPDHPVHLFVIDDRNDEPDPLQDPSPLVQVRREVAEAEPCPSSSRKVSVKVRSATSRVC